jgi:hypothetical protein
VNPGQSKNQFEGKINFTLGFKPPARELDKWKSPNEKLNILFSSVNQRNHNSFRVEHQLHKMSYAIEIDICPRVKYVESAECSG